ncbi:MAG TPA: ATPase, T2SS/T4P/T4SS family [Smithellaceae bacterium]|jgi:type IV pilus assembly protein PilB|nr:Flp pilus assembly complex ATPase component TadA [Smithella sp.]HPL95954.1 ATPase, T2SS/T4P/T4SS family [Smithellaceae bacterium]HOE31856.1 ATPase, T2SS/T4P/T4SS family [Smithella sp.]HOO35966.1 ATPase, T2SS/T4P/T4SS family [Smithella sp.]HPV52078.1 ATPase, T2SS/T4P/T4SS family [Smithella sp.]
MNKRKKLGEILIEDSIVSEGQLMSALALQKKSGKMIGQTLIELGYITEAQLVEAFRKKFSISYIDCDGVVVPEKFLKLVSMTMAVKKKILPTDVSGNTLFLAMVNPLDYSTIDEVKFLTGKNITPLLTTESSLMKAIEKNYGYCSIEKIWKPLNDIHLDGEMQFNLDKSIEFHKMEEEDESALRADDLYKIGEEPPIVKLVTLILVNAVKSRATDIHIEPHEKYVSVRYRIDGDLSTVLKISKTYQEAMTSRIKIISTMNITIRRMPQDGRSTVKYEGRMIDLRVSTIPSAHGETIVIRILDSVKGLIPLSKLGMPDNIIRDLLEMLNKPQGMLFVTGPTGSGKTTTLYSLLTQLSLESESVVTIEDPIEYELENIKQVPVNEKVGFTFAAALRSILRQDPDVIMVGEVRDSETAQISTKAALTGHLVLSSVHTNDTIATISRLRDLGIEPYLISSALNAILAQRLVKKICENCRVEFEIPQYLFENYPYLKKLKIGISYKGKGCEACGFTGYKGRIGIFEFLRVDGNLRRTIPLYHSDQDLCIVARENGMKTLIEDACEKVEHGLTTINEVLTKIHYYE